jgi:hypothetical protein
MAYLRLDDLRFTRTVATETGVDRAGDVRAPLRVTRRVVRGGQLG